jgi:hypothetical protein
LVDDSINSFFLPFGENMQRKIVVDYFFYGIGLNNIEEFTSNMKELLNI